MSERGLLLALQRLHDDPGFIDLVAADPQNTLGIYDLDETECQALTQAATNRDDNALRDMASRVGIDWTSDHISGAGTIDDEDGVGRPTRASLAARGHASEPAVTTFNSENVSPYGAASPRDHSPDVHKEP